MYDDLVQSVTIINKTHIYQDINAVSNFIKAYYRASAYASDKVIEACNEFLTSLEKKETDTVKLTEHISNIYNAVRQDKNPKSKSFNFRAFSAFAGPPQTNQPPG
jgi:hypothetical protein